MPPDESEQRMEFMLTLRQRGISDKAVLRAMDAVPREHFVETRFAESAYADRAMPIACGQTISQPYVVAYMTEQLAVRSNHRVLEIDFCLVQLKLRLLNGRAVLQCRHARAVEFYLRQVACFEPGFIDGNNAIQPFHIVLRQAQVFPCLLHVDEGTLYAGDHLAHHLPHAEFR